jgi:hypothetical protein
MSTIDKFNLAGSPILSPVEAEREIALAPDGKGAWLIVRP